MTVDQAVALMGATAVLVGAIVTLVVQLRGLHTQINSRLDQLLVLTAAASHAEGVRDQVAAQTASPVQQAAPTNLT